MQASSTPTDTISPHRRWRQVAVSLLVALLIIVTVWLGFHFVQIGLYGWNLYSSGTRVLSALRADPQPQTLAALQPEVVAMARNMEGLERQMRPFMPLLHGMKGWTTYGATLAATPELLQAGAELSAVAAEGLALATPALHAKDGAQMDALMAAIAENPTAFATMAERAARANVALLAIPEEGVHPALAQQITEIQALSPLMEPGLRMAPAFPDLLGMREPVTYLVIFQNNHELRGTGGFISAVGELTISRGQISNLDTANGYDIYSPDIEYAQAPDPIKKYLKSEILVFRDANWSPDLPTSARTARYLYEQVRGTEIDGVVTVDLDAVQLIIDALGGIEVEGVEGKITGENVIDIIKELWGNPLGTEATTQSNWQEWYEQRKDFVPVLAAAILERLQSRQFNFLTLIGAGTQSLDERSIQIWLDNADAMAQFGELGWDGALRPVAGADYLALVDSNMGFNKVNAVVTQSIDYTVAWPDGEGEPAQATTAVTYVHPIQKPGHVCDDTPRYGEDYDDMVERCYFNYVRLFVPRGSRLISIDGVEEDSISSRRGEVRTQVLAGYFIMKPGETHTVTFTYELPAALQPDGYRLIVQRQSGSSPLPLTWTIGEEESQSTTFTGNWLAWPKKE